MFEDVEFRLRSRVKSNSPEAMLIRYLNSRNTLYPARDMVMIAISSYWLPLAYQAEDQPIDLEPHIRACLYRLELHSSYLMGLLGEIPSKAATMIAVDRNTLQELERPSRTPITEQKQPLTDWLNPFSTSFK
ncbi:hypothetical protein [Nostoc sp. UHCC 0870]|uniref:hypothetical protein n=1 Tax=Nostoc sp. UHCC 0870 TaxID=2914041 RepID=UPI001EDEB9EF|nr:hypothetical protein [Nostoc sp. UHCC 0870]UKP01034.1 hypothetical protein L6494_28205 [Nostoc sp. UHCC 0870]UKP01205.1 hypothetical protein L6494_29115 [Nostoc sp. UHCC 0870]